jgi:hypothetical protein
MIPDARKDMNDLKRDRRKRNIGDIMKARSKRIDLQVQMTEALNNPFGTKVKFEQITDSKALKDLMIQKAKADGAGQVSEEVKKLRKIKEKEI